MTAFLYQIVLIGSMFTNQSVVIADQFITHEACQLAASKLRQEQRMNFQCVPIPRNNKI